MNKTLKILLIALVFVLIGVKAIPYILTNIPLGYDPGFYKAFFESYFSAIPHFDYQSIDLWIRKMYEPFLGVFSVILQLIGYSSEFLLGYGLFFFSSIVSIFIYLVLNPYGKKYAYLGIILFLISIIQYQTFWRSYYKQIVGIIFILTSIFLIHRQKYGALVPLLIASFTIQRPTGVFLLGTLVIYIVAQYFRTKKLPIPLLISLGVSAVIALLFYLPLFDALIGPLIQPLVNSVFIEGKSGTFFPINEYLYYSWPYLVLALLGLFLKIKKYKSLDMIDSGFIFGVIWLSFRLFFYNRMMIFLDLFSLLLVAYTLGTLIKYQWGKYVVGICLLVQTIWYSLYVYDNQFPLATKSEINFLSSLRYTLPKDTLMIATNSNYTPWVVGYTRFPTMAPGLLDWDPWTKEQWIEWWTHDGKFKCDFLKKSLIQKQNVYMYMGSLQSKENIDNNDCLTLVYAGSGYYLFSVNLEDNEK